MMGFSLFVGYAEKLDEGEHFYALYVTIRMQDSVKAFEFYRIIVEYVV